MRILVCVKTVPDTQEIKFDAESGAMIREGNSVTINPYDLVAIETALRCAKLSDGVVEALSMGPPSSEEGLRTAMSMGVKDAHLATSKLFAGADVLATANTLTALIKSLGSYDLIICGKHSSDGDTGQVGPELAEMLHIPHAGCVNEIVDLNQEEITVLQRLDNSTAKINLKLPCLIIPENNIYFPRIPTLSNIIKAKRNSIHIWNETNISEIKPSNYGHAGSATQVIKMYVPRKTKKATMYSSNDIHKLVKSIMDNYN